jgi:hypothetical protein
MYQKFTTKNLSNLNLIFCIVRKCSIFERCFLHFDLFYLKLEWILRFINITHNNLIAACVLKTCTNTPHLGRTPFILLHRLERRNNKQTHRGGAERKCIHRPRRVKPNQTLANDPYLVTRPHAEHYFGDCAADFLLPLNRLHYMRAEAREFKHKFLLGV